MCVVTVSGSGAAVNSVTIDGVTATIQESIAVSSFWRIAIAYRVMGSQTGTINISTDTTSTAGGACLRAYYCTGADQTTPIEDSDQGSTTFGTSQSLTLTSQTGSLVVDGLITDDNTTAWDEDTGQTEIGSPNAVAGAVSHTHHTSREAGATSVAVGWTGATSTVAQVAMSIQEAGVATVPTISNLYGSRGSGQSGELIPGLDNLSAAGTNYESAQGTGGLYLADSAIWATATKIKQTTATWSATAITTHGTNIGTLLGSAQSGTLHAFVQNDSGEVSAAYAVYVAHRDVRVVTGTFTTPASPTSTFDVTHPRLGDNKVKGLILWTSGVTTEDSAQGGWVSNMGIWAGSAMRSISQFSQDGLAVASANTGRERWTDRILNQYDDSGATAENVATVVGSIAGGFRLNFSAATSGRRVHYIAFAGEDVEAAIGSATVSSGTAGGHGFDIEFCWMMTFCDANGDPAENFGTQSFGCWNDTIEQAYWSSYLGNESADQATQSAAMSDDGSIGQVFQGSLTWELAVTSSGNESFSWTGSNADGFDYLAVNLAGIRTKISQFAKSTATAPVDQTLASLGFVPQCYGLMSAQRTDEAVSATDPYCNLGFYDGVNQWCQGLSNDNNPTTTESNSRSLDDSIICQTTASGGGKATEAYAYPIDNTQQPKLRWTTNNTSAWLLTVVAFEHPEAGNDKPRGIRPNVFSW